ncbi:glycosyl hydrolase family 28 protein [Sphingomonas sp. BIUV-7]|uniref:Glycosyl hydrolase family 28 protein n=1 Tax=Sphingomonas natans TaxID=3063330 RepID=A0ABT8Y3H6_9SPHN|nr:glycosyl hydrolase family 28 protein [Sphingomonas sp. BIUV-7]MDO6412864.1 glycosyl hydrolase family 28 protein [Sphingomonas sp. BIUV-7]
MLTQDYTRRAVTLSLLSAPLWPAFAAGAGDAPITKFGAKADGVTINTRAIQATIDAVAKRGGGTVIVPPGVFVSGALFLKPKVNLHLEKGAVLRCSTDLANFPEQRTRIEGHFEEHFNPGLINAKGCDGLRISGAGTLDGAGRPIWDMFWKLRNAAPDPHNFRNVGVPRARLAVIESSRGVTIEGVTFKDSQFWNLHLYRCEDVTVRNARFEVPDDYKQAPSTDGIDLDSCRQVTIEGCYFSVTDDCIAAKGSKGPHAMEDKDSPPVEGIRVRNCEFRRGNGILTLGSEATIVRDVIVEDCRITGNVKIAALKLRADTPQHYEDIHFRNITLDAAGGTILAIVPWSQYTDLKGAPPPQSVVRNVSLSGIKGRFGAFGAIRGNPGQTTISDIRLEDVDVTLAQPKLEAEGVSGLRFERVRVNGVVRG